VKIKTRDLVIAGGILTILMITQVFVYGSFFKAMKNDAELINEVGRIRGSVQRLVKMELQNNKDNEIRKDIEILVTSYINNPDIMDYDHTEQVNNIKTLKQSWEELQLLLDNYHLSPTKQKRNHVLAKSEEVWVITNESVLNAQKIAEENISYFRYFTAGFVLNVLAMIIIVFIFKKRIYDVLKISAIHDPLTKAFNRRYFNEYINNEILRGQRKNKIFSLIMLDIDHFKNINDTYGHVKGDYVLATLVEVVGENIRRYDVLSRIGGEEFTILLPDTGMEDAFHLAERVRSSVSQYPFDGIPPMTISLGVVEFRKNDDSASMLARADQAMYKAKNDGRNRTEKG